MSNKDIVLLRDFNLNLLDFYHRKSVKIYENKLFKNNFLQQHWPRKPTWRVNSKLISEIDYIKTNLSVR